MNSEDVVKKNRIAKFAPLLLLTALFLVLTFYGEKIQINDGLGYDGTEYARIAGNFQELFLKREITPYRLFRVFPSAAVHYGIKLLRFPLSNANILRGFEIYHFIMLLISLFIWSRISDAIGLSEKNRWFSHVLLFGSFAVLKMNFYYPVLTDTTAFTLGLALLYFYITENTAGILIMLFVSFFTWPVAALNAVILFVFPKRLSVARAPAKSAAKTIAALACVLYVVFFSYFHFFSEYSGGIAISMKLLPLSILCILIYIYMIVYFLLKNISISRVFLSENYLFIKRAAIIFVLFAALKSVHAFFSLPHSDGNAVYSIILYRIFVTPAIRPAVFLLAHVIYFGPAVIIATVFFDKIAKIAQGYGIGLITLLIANLSFAIFAESRSGINIVPFVVFVVVLFLKDIKWDNKAYLFFTVISLILSKAWLKLNTNPDFYKMNFGYLIPRQWYIIQGVFVILCFLVCVLIRRHYTRYSSSPDRRIETI